MSTEDKQALFQRLDIFLEKLKARYHEIMGSVEQPLEETINNLQYDTIQIININNALRDQAVTQLDQKAEAGYEKMSEQFYKLGFSHNEEKSAMDRLKAFKYYLESEFTTYEVTTFAKAARKILSNVQEHVNLNKLHRCTQCGAELPIKIYSFMSVNIKCESCGSVNTYVPDDRVRALEYYVLNYLADEKALPLKIKGIRERKAMSEYWKAHYEFLIENIPDKKEQYERMMKARMGNMH